VLDALAPVGVTDIDMPLTPEAVWRAIAKARAVHGLTESVGIPLNRGL
jgi:hypothetical protein